MSAFVSYSDVASAVVFGIEVTASVVEFSNEAVYFVDFAAYAFAFYDLFDDSLGCG